MSLLLALQGVNPGMPNWDPERELPQEEARVITPEQFRSGVVPVTDPRLIQYFIEHPAELQRIDPRKFEELVAELMTKFGYRARVGPVGKDGGVDVTAERDGVVAPEFVLIQCKRHGPDNKVTIATVKQLYADVEAHRATSGLVVTTSYFTAPAEKFIDSVKYRLAGRDFDKLTEWLAEAHKAIVGGSR